MKRIYLLMILFVAAAANAFAQRSVDLEVTMAQPTTSTVVNPGNAGFNIDVIIKNLGPDSLKSTTDSTMWYATISSSPISWTFSGNTGTVWLRYNRGLKMNDTMHMTFNGIAFSQYSSEKDSNRTLCWYAFPIGKKPSDTIKDPNTANNSKCVSFMFRKTKFPQAVANVTANDVCVIYPNPAQNAANFSFNVASPSAVTLVITDMTGRVVVNKEMGVMTTGSHSIPVDTKNLPNGTYTSQLYVGKEMMTGKLNIQR